jgi:hypothetical protein
MIPEPVPVPTLLTYTTEGLAAAYACTVAASMADGDRRADVDDNVVVDADDEGCEASTGWPLPALMRWSATAPSPMSAAARKGSAILFMLWIPFSPSVSAASVFLTLLISLIFIMRLQHGTFV